MRPLIISLVVSFALAGTASAEEPAPHALLFGKKCAGCHTIGEGDRAGPDLLGVTQRRDRLWLQSFIRAPGATIDKGDSVANELLGKFKGLRMPDQPLSDEDLDGLLTYLDGCAKAGGCKITLGKVRPASEATSAEVALGRSLFEGRTRLAKGGPACLQCHNVAGAGVLGGGSLARDLTFVHARLGDAGLQSALETLPFPLMKDIYAKAQLASEEAFALKAYLGAASRHGAPALRDHNFLYLGVVGLFASLGVIGAAWSGRMGGVRKAIVKRGAK